MKQTTPMIPGYQICEYMLVITPHEELRNKITGVREEFNKAFKIPATPNKPNLMLGSFTQYVMMEERIVNKLNAIAMGHYPFKVELRDFGSFPAHTVYINVTSKVPVQDLVRKIRTETQGLMKLSDEKKPYFAMEPHMTIARKLKPWQYEASWLEYSQKHFTGRFIASEMILLKRIEGDKAWIVAKHLEFQNLPVAVRQGELFG